MSLERYLYLIIYQCIKVINDLFKSFIVNVMLSS